MTEIQQIIALKGKGKSSIAETLIGQNASVDLQDIDCDLLDGEKRESSEDFNISPPEICTNFFQMRNNSTFNVLGEAIFRYQDKKYLLYYKKYKTVTLVKN